MLQVYDSIISLNFISVSEGRSGYGSPACYSTTRRCLRFLVFVSAYRADNFIVGLTDVSPATTAPTLWNYDVCARYPGVVDAGATVNLTCTSCMPPRRYLIVQVELDNNQLNFCEIEVYIRGNLFFL